MSEQLVPFFPLGNYVPVFPALGPARPVTSSVILKISNDPNRRNVGASLTMIVALSCFARNNVSYMEKREGWQTLIGFPL